MQGKPVGVGRDIVARPVIAQVVLSFPGWIHDEVVGPGNDLKAHQAGGEEWLEHLIALGRLRGVVDRIGQEPPDRSDELFDAVAVALQDRVLEVKRQMACGGGGPVLALG